MSANKATFALGCFWQPDLLFSQLPGVSQVTVGYTGGQTSNPTYEEVCTGTTGHAEAVEIEFDPAKINYADLLKVFWANHDPTTLNRQGPDTGSQYRSAIFYHDEEQARLARESLVAEGKSGKHHGEIVTQVAPAGSFYPAEEYHQKYLAKRGRNTCG